MGRGITGLSAPIPSTTVTVFLVANPVRKQLAFAVPTKRSDNLAYK
jgi:hypothetical protein